MGKATLSGPLMVGTNKDGAVGTNNLGTSLLAQKMFFVTPALAVSTTDADGQTTTTYLGQPAVAWNATAGANATTISVQLPANVAIHDIVIDQSLVTTGTNATLAFTAGISAAGVEYVASTDIKTTVRLIPTYTAAHLIAMRNIGTNTSFFAQINTPTNPVTAGVTSVTVLYMQR